MERTGSTSADIAAHIAKAKWLQAKAAVGQFAVTMLPTQSESQLLAQLEHIAVEAEKHYQKLAKGKKRNVE